METNQPIKWEILSGLAQYTFIHAPDKGNPKHRIGPAYKIDLMLNDAKQLKKAESLGLVIREKDDKHPHPFVTIKSKVKEGRNPPLCIDSQKNPIPKNILIGNGSEVRVRFLPWSYGEGEVTAILQEIQVVKLVEYKPTKEEVEKKGAFLDKVEGGFTVVNTNKEPVA